jgi:hypothetical protein
LTLLTAGSAETDSLSERVQRSAAKRGAATMVKVRRRRRRKEVRTGEGRLRRKVGESSREDQPLDARGRKCKRSREAKEKNGKHS